MSSERRGLLLVAAAALLWSTGGIGIKWLSQPPLVIAFYRSATAAVALFAIFRPRVWRWTPAFLVGIASYAGCLTTFCLATKWTSAANAIFLQYCGVVWVLLAAPLILEEPFYRRDAIAVAVAFAGMLLFFVGRFESRGYAGEIAALTSSVFFAILVLSLRRERGGGAEAVVTYGNVLAALALLPFVHGQLAVPRLDAVVLTALGVLQIGVAYALFVAGLRHITATEASLVGMLEPISNPIWVFLFLGESPGAYSVLGGAIVLGAIAWRTLTSGPAVAVPPPD
ncbi:MAG TPA: DMT family transporter [Thermoanaerobaculia bacterium]|nr:DMT family transporter [Thermoanaerobaculia bacterium]